VPTSAHHITVEQALCRQQTAVPGPGGDADRLRWLLRRIADDDRGAFTELFYRVSGPVSSAVRRQVSDPLRVASVVAGTFVEVWWLAGCHINPETDVMAWINKIAWRRVADSRPPAKPAADSVAPTPVVLTALWTQRVEVELAGLLGRRTTPSDAR
jgi:DNA-directed RNA polymerase specialized sigma24 family protein